MGAYQQIANVILKTSNPIYILNLCTQITTDIINLCLDSIALYC